MRTAARFTRVFLIMGLLLAAPALASDAETGALTEPSGLEALLMADLAAFQGVDFGSLLSRWQQAYGERAGPALLRLANRSSLADPNRYIAVMAAARLGASTTALERLLGDEVWLVRSAALQALRLRGDPEAGPGVLPLLRDPSLIVRREAALALARLRTPAAAPALLQAACAEENYSRGHALWVPQAALRALVALGAREVVPSLRPLLLRYEDPALQRSVIEALTALTGRSLGGLHASLAAQVLEWERFLRNQRQPLPKNTLGAPVDGLTPTISSESG